MPAVWRAGLFLALLHVLALPLAGCAEQKVVLPPASPNTARIVSSLPKKGSLAAQSKLIAQAIDLAIAERKEVIPGWTIEHLALDGGSDESGDWSRERELANAEAATQDLSVVAYIGPYNSGAVALSLPITNRARLLQGSPTTTWPGLTLPGWGTDEPEVYYPSGERTFVRMMPHDARQADAAARWAAADKITRLFVVSDAGGYSGGLGSYFMSTAGAVGLEIVGQGVLSLGSEGTLVKRILASEAGGAFYAPSSARDALLLAKALRQGGSTLPVYVTDTALNDQFAQGVTDGASSWRFTLNGVSSGPDDEAARVFEDKFQQRYNTSPSQFAANAYDLTNLVLDAVEETKSTDRETITGKVLGTRGKWGATGSLDFDERGDRAEWRISGYRLEGGEFVLERILESSP